MSEHVGADGCLRAMTAQNGFRAIAVRSTQTVEAAIEAQDVDGQTARLFGELLTGAVLIRETMAPKMRVQAILKERKGGSMVADSHPDGMTRGLVNLRGEPTVPLGGDTNLQLVRELPNGALQQSVVATTAEHGLSASLTTYMARSEQIETVIAVGCVLDGRRPTAAGGYIIQHMPGADREILAAITDRLERLGPVDRLLVDTAASPGQLLDRVLDEVEFDALEQRDIHFGCNCSTKRFVRSLATLGQKDLEDLLADDEPLDITCDYCAHHYRISTTRLRSLLDAVS